MSIEAVLVTTVARRGALSINAASPNHAPE
jgi:hypothetical protein